MWNWLEARHRNKILETPFPGSWLQYLERSAYFSRLAAAEKRDLQELVQVFIAEKTWEGCGGLELTDEIRVTIAGCACLLILRLPHDLYRGVQTILVYPTTVYTPEEKVGVFQAPQGPVQAPTAILGEAHHHGPVILVWDAVLRDARSPKSGHNVVFHEFAHKLDMLDGHADGTPPLRDTEQYRQWVQVCSSEFLRLKELVARGKHTFLDSYGAVNEAEFFAVVTEEFFSQSRLMKLNHPALYGVLQDYFQQDPAAL